MKRDILSVCGIVFISLSLFLLSYLFATSVTKHFFNQLPDHADTWLSKPLPLAK